MERRERTHEFYDEGLAGATTSNSFTCCLAGWSSVFVAPTLPPIPSLLPKFWKTPDDPPALADPPPPTTTGTFLGSSMRPKRIRALIQAGILSILAAGDPGFSFANVCSRATRRKCAGVMPPTPWNLEKTARSWSVLSFLPIET